MVASPVDELRALVALEHEDARESERLHGLDADVAELRSRNDVVVGFFASQDDEERRLRSDEEEARAEVARRDEEVAAAEQELARARDDDERALAEQRLVRARDHAAVAAHGAEDAAERHAAFARASGRVADERPRLERRARELAERIPGAPAATDDLDDWSSGAHAALFVAVGQVEVRRERAIREANELASALVGEPTYGSTPEQALARVERYCASSPGHVSESR
jgi:hypothetical protein